MGIGKQQLHRSFSYNPGNWPGSLYEVTANDLATKSDESIPGEPRAAASARYVSSRLCGT